MTDFERQVLAELLTSFPVGSFLYWRDAGGELVVRELDAAGIEEALRAPATPIGASAGAALDHHTQPRDENEQLDLLDEKQRPEEAPDDRTSDT